MSKIKEIFEAVEKGKAKTIKALVEEALAEGIEPFTILNEGMVAAMNLIGDKFQRAEAFIPEMLISAKTMKTGVDVLKTKLGGASVATKGKAIIGTVQGDLHDIGKNLVVLMLESVGFEVINLGADVTPDAFVKALKENPDARVVGLSCLLTTTMPAMEETLKALKASGISGFKVIVGGAPVTPEYAKKIGADGYSPDAAGAAELAKKLSA